jgi:5-methylcytosine-specific restriction enzyme A
VSRWRDLAERLDGKAPTGARRSSQWQTVRNNFLLGKSCAVCGGKRKLIAHHEIPFHLSPDLELDESNLIPLCEAERYGINCHLLIGHLGNWQRTNVICRADIAYWQQRLIEDR